MDKRDQATFIAGYPKSGTTLIAALLDNHPELLVFPEEFIYTYLPISIRKYKGDLLELMFRQKRQQLSRLKGEANYLDAIYPEKVDYKDFPFDDFTSNVQSSFQKIYEKYCNEYSRPVIAILSLIEGYELTMNQRNYMRWVVKNPRYEFHWKTIFKDFPKARLIYMLRDPRDALFSKGLKQKKKKQVQQYSDENAWQPSNVFIRPSFRHLKEWERSIIAVENARRAFPHQVITIRYEDLTSQPHAIMNTVIDFLGIRWHDNLLVPSFRGTTWGGNSMRQQKFDGIGNIQARNRLHFSPPQLWQIEAWLGNRLTRLPGHYLPSGVLDKMDMKALCSRLSEEYPFAFIQNRIRMWRNWHQRNAIHTT